VAEIQFRDNTRVKKRASKNGGKNLQKSFTETHLSKNMEVKKMEIKRRNWLKQSIQGEKAALPQNF